MSTKRRKVILNVLHQSELDGQAAYAAGMTLDNAPEFKKSKNGFGRSIIDAWKMGFRSAARDASWAAGHDKFSINMIDGIRHSDLMPDRLLERFAIHEPVLVLHDCDGAEGRIGIIKTVWDSGRYTIEFPDGSFRSFAESVLKKVATEESREQKE